MIVSLSGTPGTGKTSTAEQLDPQHFEILSMNELTEKYKSGVDERRGSAEVDIDRLVNDIQEGSVRLPAGEEKHIVIEGHLSHYLPVDIIIVLRTSTKELEVRLQERSYSAEKIRENMEAEAMGVISLEALDSPFPVYEVDTTDLSPKKAAERCEILIQNRLPPLTGPEDIIDFTGEILEWY